MQKTSIFEHTSEKKNRTSTRKNHFRNGRHFVLVFPKNYTWNSLIISAGIVGGIALRLKMIQINDLALSICNLCIKVCHI